MTASRKVRRKRRHQGSDLNWIDSGEKIFDSLVDNFDELLSARSEARTRENLRTDVTDADVKKSYEELIPPPESKKKNTAQIIIAKIAYAIGAMAFGGGIKYAFDSQFILSYAVVAWGVGFIIMTAGIWLEHLTKK